MSEPANNTNIAKALLAAQKEIEGVSKNAENPHFGNRFADLTAVIEATVPVLNKHGIAVIQLPTAPLHDGQLALATLLLHESGESIQGVAYVPLSKNDPQAYGSAMTYARRYSLGSAVGLKFIDDDAEAAVGRGSFGEKSAPVERPKPIVESTGGGFLKAKPSKATEPNIPGHAAAPKRGKTSLFPRIGVVDAEGVDAE